MVTTVNSSPSVLPFFSPSIGDCGIGALQTKISSVAKSAFHYFEKAWSYIGKSLLLTRHLLNAGLQSCRWALGICNTQTTQKVAAAVSHLKLFACISIPLNLTVIPPIVQKIEKSIQWGDFEGVALSSLSLSLIALDMLDSAATFTSGLIQTLSLTPIEWLGATATPLAGILIALGSISRTTRLVHLSQFLQQLSQELLAKIKDQNLSPVELKGLLQTFLNDNLKKSPENRDALQAELRAQIDECKKAVLERHTNSKTVTLLCSLAESIERNETLTQEHTEAVSEILQEVKSVLDEEMWVQGAYLLTNMLNALALILFFVAIPTLVPFLLLALSFAARIGLLAYQDFYQSRPATLSPNAKRLLALA